jgi:hypothetical protein
MIMLHKNEGKGEGDDGDETLSFGVFAMRGLKEGEEVVLE